MNNTIFRFLPRVNRSQRRRVDSLSGPAASADSADRIARRLEPLLPVVMALHGGISLHIYGGAPWLWGLLVVVAATSLAGFMGSRRRSRRARARRSVAFRAVCLVAASMLLAANTGGVESPFCLWLFAIVAVYPLLLRKKWSALMPLGVAAVYVLLWSLSSATHPFYEVLSQAALLIFVGLLIHNFGARVKTFEHIRKLANIDELTRVFNRRHFFERAKCEYDYCSRHRSPLTAVLFDLNEFKQINDSGGHALGDECLRRFARHLATEARKDDVVARLGGDEFVVLLPETGTKGAAELIRRVRTRLQRDPVALPSGDLTLSACAGVSTMTQKTKGLEALLEKADRDLYRAKDQLAVRVVSRRREGHLRVA